MVCSGAAAAGTEPSLFLDQELDPGCGTGSWRRAGCARASTGALPLLPEPPRLLLGKACEGPWVTAPSWHGAESRQPWPLHCGQWDEEGEEAAPASPSRWPCLQERGHGASSAVGGVWRGQD